MTLISLRQGVYSLLDRLLTHTKFDRNLINAVIILIFTVQLDDCITAS